MTELPKIRIREFGEPQLDQDAPLSLPACEIHVWQASTLAFNARIQELATLLSGEETRRMGRFYFQQDRIRFAVAHGILRKMIGRYLNTRPWLIDFRNGSKGKPELHGPCAAAGFFFNISHSHQLVALAFSKIQHLGIDVEHIRDIPDFDEMAGYYFHPTESAVLQFLPFSKRQQYFFDCWTCKEAFVKATGEGLSRPLHSFFACADNKTANGILRIKGEGVSDADWRILSFEPVQGYAGAVAFGV